MPVKLNSSGGGSVTLNQPTTATDYNQNLLPASGNVIITPVPAGNSTVAPLILTPGTNLASAVQGALEFDGTTLYYTPIGTQRGVVPGMQFYSHPLSGRAGAQTTANQSILGVGCTVTAGTLYQYQGRFNFFKTAGGTSHTMSYSWGGTATFVNNRIVTNMIIQSSAQGYTTQNTARTAYHYVMETPASFAFSGSIASAFYTTNIMVDGLFVANTTGTLIPQYSLSADPGGAYTASAGNYLAIWPVSAPNLTSSNTANVSIGTWA